MMPKVFLFNFYVGFKNRQKINFDYHARYPWASRTQSKTLKCMKIAKIGPTPPANVFFISL